MTWREIFTRLWFVLRAHWNKHEMCARCGDALVGGYREYHGHCEACREEWEQRAEELYLSRPRLRNAPLAYMENLIGWRY